MLETYPVQDGCIQVNSFPNAGQELRGSNSALGGWYRECDGDGGADMRGNGALAEDVPIIVSN